MIGVLLDRDGTLIEERGYLGDPGGVALLPGVADALRALAGAGFALCVVSNQSGIGRGYYAEADAHRVHARCRELVAAAGARLDAVYHCPHPPAARCACRKPARGLAERAARELGLDLRRSWVVGDKECDLRLGWNVGARTALVRTGYGRRTEARLQRCPDVVADGLADVAGRLCAVAGAAR